jgi:hypothetical protein
MNRRSLIQLLIGVIAAVAGLTTMILVRQDRCLDAGGSWSATTRVCLGPDGPVAVAQASDMIVAVFIGLLVAFMLHRASTFANRHAPRPPA